MLAGGIAVLIAVFKKLKIDVMKVADGALRYGILYDLAGRKLQRDPREASVERMMNRSMRTRSRLSVSAT